MTRLEPSGQTFDGSSLLPMWRRLDALDKEMEAADAWYARTQELTDRRLDSSDRPGRRAYIDASSLIGKAREHQLLLAQTFTTPRVNVFPHATPNIIRPAFEAAARALWILDGETAQERRFRGLRIAWEDHNESRKWAEELMVPRLMPQDKIEAQHAKHAAITKRFHDDADALRINWDKVKAPMNLRDEVGKFTVLETDPDLAVYLRAIWRRMSGVQHGMSYASLLGTEHHQQVQVPGGFETLLLTDDETLLTECRASALLQHWAIQKYIQRTTELRVR